MHRPPSRRWKSIAASQYVPKEEQQSNPQSSTTIRSQIRCSSFSPSLTPSGLPEHSASRPRVGFESIKSEVAKTLCFFYGFPTCPANATCHAGHLAACERSTQAIDRLAGIDLCLLVLFCSSFSSAGASRFGSPVRTGRSDAKKAKLGEKPSYSSRRNTSAVTAQTCGIPTRERRQQEETAPDSLRRSDAAHFPFGDALDAIFPFQGFSRIDRFAKLEQVVVPINRIHSETIAQLRLALVSC